MRRSCTRRWSTVSQPRPGRRDQARLAVQCRQHVLECMRSCGVLGANKNGDSLSRTLTRRLPFFRRKRVGASSLIVFASSPPCGASGERACVRGLHGLVVHHPSIRISRAGPFQRTEGGLRKKKTPHKVLPGAWERLPEKGGGCAIELPKTTLLGVVHVAPGIRWMSALSTRPAKWMCLCFPTDVAGVPLGAPSSPSPPV